MASETVANSPIGTYQVEVDRTATGSERQAVGIDIGTVAGDVLTPSRVSASNPLPTTATISGTPDVNLAEVGGAAVSLGQKAEASSIPVVNSINPSLAGFFPYIDSNQAAGVGCTTTSVVCLSTSAYRAGDWVIFRDIGVLALRRVTRQIVSIDSATAFTVSPALPATPTNGVDYFDILRATPIPTNGSVPSVNIASSTALSVTNGGLTELAAAIGTIDSSTPLIASGIQLAGDDPYAFDGPKIAAPYVVSQAPGASDFGLVVRNIPSGTQTVSGTVAATQSGTWNINNVSGTVSLPTGAATAALQTTGNSWLSNISNNTDNFNATFQLDSRSSATGVLALGYSTTGGTYNAADIDANGAVLTRPADTTTTSAQTITANSQRRSVTLGDNKYVNVDISGTYGSIAIIFEISFDGGTTYRTVQLSRVDANTVETASGTISNTTRTWRGNVGAATQFSVRSTAYTSGTMNVVINTSRNDAEPNPTTQTHAVTQSGTWSTRTQDGSGNAIASATALPGASDRGFVTRTFAYLYDGDGNKTASSSSGPSYNSNGLFVRQVTGALGSAAEPSQYATLRGNYYVGSRTTTTGSTTTVINTTTDPSTIAGVGYYVRITSGSFSNGLYEDAPIASCSSSAITLKHPLRIAPGSGQTVYIYKPTTLTTDSTGSLNTTAYVSNTINVIPTAGNKFFQDGATLAFGSISGAYATVLTTPGVVNMLAVANLTNVAMIFSFDGGSHDALALAAGQTTTFALTANGGYIDASQDIQVKDAGTAAGSGFVHVGVYYQ